jgi:hypothetical protein
MRAPCAFLYATAALDERRGERRRQREKSLVAASADRLSERRI